MVNSSDKHRQPTGFTSAHPLPTVEELRKFYSEMYYQAPQSSSYQEAYDDLDLRHKRLKCEALLHAVTSLGIPEHSFLDIGAGEGFLMASAQRRGYDVTGIDLSSYGVTKFHPALVDSLLVGDIYDGLARLAESHKKFDCCSSINVLEHVIDPDLFLASISGVMSSDGVLVVTVPNDFSRLHDMLLRDGLIDREFWYAPPHHLHYFNTDNLIPYLSSRGFEVLDAFSDFPIDLYLLHPGSNYVMNKDSGPAAHRARLLHDLLIADQGMEKYLNYYRAMFAVGLGRNITVILRQGSER